MRPKTLNRKPLVEAILEIRWVPSYAKDTGIDANTRLFLGKFYDLVKREYPAFEVLPQAAAPEQLAPHIVQYRFRKRDGGWPLVQIGSGVLTLNETSSYSWEDYRRRAEEIVHLLTDLYPAKISPTVMELRYINAVHVDFEKQPILPYLAEKMRVELSLPKELFDNIGVQAAPFQFALQAGFPMNAPMGVLHFRLIKGKSDDKDAIIWETNIHSEGKEVPVVPDGFPKWLEAAHVVAEEWFFRLVEYNLLEQMV